jgi:hypothetical protein
MGNVTMVLQGLGLLVLSLIVGSMFGTWRGYDPSGFTASAFLEIHQGSVRGLNTLLPAMGFAAILLTAAIAVLMRDRPALLGIYAAAAVLMIIAGLVTRFGNQPINELVMGWTPDTMPADWASLRDSWWSSHLIRLGAAFAAEVLLIVAIFADRTATA